MPTITIVAILVLIFYGMCCIDYTDKRFTTIEMIEKHGYLVESHHITTEDGYILTYHRIPHGINDNGTTPRPAVILMHGLVSSSEVFVNKGPGRSLAFILADRGYDVWIANTRGNVWCRNHTSLDVVLDAEQFFDFSWHEIGYYDITAAVDYILEINGDESLYFVGHSQGGAAFLVFASTRLEYNDKIKLASLMGPSCYMKHINKIILKILSEYVYYFESIFVNLGIYEVPFTEIIRDVGIVLCSQPKIELICQLVVGLIDGLDLDQLEYGSISMILNSIPSSSSIKQVFHYGQLIRNGGLRQYDYGNETNVVLYGTETPPAYDLSKITTPVAVYYGKNDGLANYVDVETLINNLENLVVSYVVPHELFNHMDFLWGKDVVDMLYDKLIQVMDDYQK